MVRCKRVCPHHQLFCSPWKIAVPSLSYKGKREAHKTMSQSPEHFCQMVFPDPSGNAYHSFCFLLIFTSSNASSNTFILHLASLTAVPDETPAQSQASNHRKGLSGPCKEKARNNHLDDTHKK